MKPFISAPVVGVIIALAGPSEAADVYKIGVSAGLTGYAAAVPCVLRRERLRRRPR